MSAVGSIYDRNGREILRGDVVKVFHFTGPRRKRHYMYKQAMGTRQFGSGVPYMVFDHLNLDADHYHECCDGRTLREYEIIQSIDCKFEERPKRPSPTPTEDAG